MIQFSQKIILIVIILCYINTSYAVDLIQFGQDCLLKEVHLNNIKAQLRETEKQESSFQEQSARAIETTQQYQKELIQLEARNNECSNTTPNSVFCHQTRKRYSDIVTLLQQTEAQNPRSSDALNSLSIFITQASFEKQQADFYAFCRDSDIHYKMINNSAAYQTVCLTGNNKTSVTCSLF
ncbi:hypothetical protein OAH87_06315 [Marinomonas sp.]|nr:hypothetical protein [Marinomonas sp.]MDB4838064.1 hypothetical protein [Marinomonas sp.]